MSYAKSIEKADKIREVMDFSLNCQIEIGGLGDDPFPILREFWERFPLYNNMKHNGIMFLIAEIEDAMPKIQFGEGNPNNGKNAVSIVLGNESSAVMYIKLDKFLIKRSEKEMQRVWHRIQVAAQMAGVDEMQDLSTEPDEYSQGCYTYRLWWD